MIQCRSVQVGGGEGEGVLMKGQLDSQIQGFELKRELNVFDKQTHLLQVVVRIGKEKRFVNNYVASNSYKLYLVIVNIFF